MFGRGLWVLALCAATLLVLAGATPRPGALRGPSVVLQTVLAPVERATAAVWRQVAGAVHGVVSLWSLRADNARLRAEVAQLQYQLTRQAALQAQVQQLSTLLHLGKFAAQQGLGPGVPAQVIARSPSGWLDALVVDQGTRAGVTAGMVAVTTTGLVGRVEPGVGPTTSRVMLLTNPDFGVGIQVQRASSLEQGVAVGRVGTSELVATFFSPKANVQPGDLLVTSGLATPGVGESFPAGLPVGTVVRVSSGDFGLARQAEVEPTANLQSVSAVLLLPAGGGPS